MPTNNSYPIKVKIEVGVTDGKQRGEATYLYDLGLIPNDEDMVNIFEEIKKSLPEGFYIMGYEDHFAHIFQEKYGPSVPIAAPKPAKPWYDPVEEFRPTDLWDITWEEADEY